MPEFDEYAQYAELAALADGSLSGERAAALRARVDASPELTALLAEQQRAIGLLRGVGSEAGASAALRARVERGEPGAAAPVAEGADRRRRRLAPAHLGGALGAAVALGLALFLVLAGGNSQLTVSEVVAAGARGPLAGPPAPTAAEPKLLDVSVEDVPFPNYVAKFGWRALGVRHDELDGHAVTTVFYERTGHRIAYSIVAGDALKAPPDGVPAVVEGTRLLALARGGRQAVTWTRGAHTCVLSGSDVPRATLLALGGWKGKGAIPF